MADSLRTQGKIKGMEGIESEIVSVSLSEADLGGIATTTVDATDFTVNGTTGQLSNTSAISFTIEAADVGKTAAIVSINASSGEMLRIDLSTPIELTTEGTATIAIGDLTADL